MIQELALQFLKSESILMRLYSVRGNVVDLSPLLSEVCALWLRSGFNERFVTWMKITELYGHRLTGQIQHPWMMPNDSLIALNPPKGLLRWLLVFSNPAEAMGKVALTEVSDAVTRSLDLVVKMRAQSISFIHIPSTHNNEIPSDSDNLESATVMVQAIQQWTLDHPEHDLNVYLVDHDGDFERVPGVPALDLAFH